MWFEMDEPPPRGRLPRTLVISTGWEVSAARAIPSRTSWPPPSPVRPSSTMGLVLGICGDFWRGECKTL